MVTNGIAKSSESKLSQQESNPGPPGRSPVVCSNLLGHSTPSLLPHSCNKKSSRLFPVHYIPKLFSFHFWWPLMHTFISVQFCWTTQTLNITNTMTLTGVAAYLRIRNKHINARCPNTTYARLLVFTSTPTI